MAQNQITTGPYKGKSYEHIADIDPNYIVKLYISDVEKYQRYISDELLHECMMKSEDWSIDDQFSDLYE